MLLIQNGRPRVLSLVPATRENVPLLVKTRQKAWDATYRGIYPDEAIDEFDYSWHEKAECNRLNDPEYHCLLVMEGDSCLGYVAYGNVPPAGEDDPSFRLHSLYLLPEVQGVGLGRTLLRYAQRACREQGKGRLFLDCHPDNKPALGFYQHMGGFVTYVTPRHENPMEDSCRLEFYLD